jgi:hypothetical protein
MVKYGRQRDAADIAVAGLMGVRNIKDDSDVSMDTSGSTVTLRGHFRTWAEHDAVVGAGLDGRRRRRPPRRPRDHRLTSHIVGTGGPA